ncbi:hypothetical protein [Oceanobacillus kapialis]|uniref:SPOR domain-containing protein n=1 Tax=Oceanobacillus kapialis TaxID=481353 RepID=A0ABW5PZ68_9BACI
MDKDKTVVLWENGKQIKLKVNTSSKLSDPQSKQETAASVERLPNEDDVPLFQRKTPSEYHAKSKKPKRWTTLKPVLLTIVSALGVGTLLGIIMLRMFGSIDTEMQSSSNVAVPAEMETTEEQNANAEITLDSLSAFVLQAGVFTGRENAAEAAKVYEDAGVQTVLWERDNQFYLLAGMALNKEAATELRDDLTEEGLEFYVKEWNTSAITSNVTEENKTWLENLQKNVIETKEGLAKDRPFNAQAWKELAQTIPTQPDHYATLAKEVNHTADNAEKLSSQEAQNQLLLLWNLYTKAVATQ